MHQFSSKYQSSFNILHNYFDDLLKYTPTIFLKSNDYKSIERPTFIYILEKDVLSLKEIDIWDCVIKWGIGQVENFDGEKDISELNKDDFKSLKKILEDIIPLVRFQNISYVEFEEKIIPFEDLFSNTLWKNISSYYTTLSKKSTLNLSPTSNLLQPRITIDSTTITDKKIIFTISNWINGSYSQIDKYNSYRNVKYEFKLLYCSSRDGLCNKIFHQKCDNVQRILVVGKIKNTQQLIGGYNPRNWSGMYYNVETTSFVFNITNRDDVNSATTKFSNVIIHRHAIWCCKGELPSFGHKNLAFEKDGKVTVLNVEQVYNEIGIVNGSKYDELEVFQIINKT